MVNNGKGLSVDGIKEMRGGEYVLDGYITPYNSQALNARARVDYCL